MSSPTQRRLRPGDVAARVGAATGARVTACAPLTGGGFAAVWRADLDDGRAVVLKVGPPPGVRLLRYEAGLLDAEAWYYRLVRERVPDVPVPRLLHHGDGWLCTGLLPGEPLTAGAAGGPDADAAVRRGLGAAVARLHTVTGPSFGYTGGRSAGSTWVAAFTAIVEDLLADAVDWRVELPVPAGLIHRVVRAGADTLAQVDRAALLHFDLWDGNVLAVAGRLTGLVDGERFLFGDPLLDLVSPALFRRIEDEPDNPFRRGYGGPAPDPPARHRLALYRVHLYLLMLVEMPSRGMTGAAAADRRTRLTRLLVAELDRLPGGRPGR